MNNTKAAARGCVETGNIISHDAARLDSFRGGSIPVDPASTPTQRSKPTPDFGCRTTVSFCHRSDDDWGRKRRARRSSDPVTQVGPLATPTQRRRLPQPNRRRLATGTSLHHYHRCAIWMTIIMLGTLSRPCRGWRLSPQYFTHRAQWNRHQGAMSTSSWISTSETMTRKSNGGGPRLTTRCWLQPLHHGDNETKSTSAAASTTSPRRRTNSTTASSGGRKRSTSRAASSVASAVSTSSSSSSRSKSPRQGRRKSAAGATKVYATSAAAAAAALVEEVDLEEHSVQDSVNSSLVPPNVAEMEPLVDHPSDLLHPDELFNGTIPLPKALSPSAVLEFQKCPQSFLFQYLYSLRQPSNPALARGSMCHSALEQIFDIEPPAERTLECLQNLFRRQWSLHRNTDTYRHLFDAQPADEDVSGSPTEPPQRNISAEAEWGRRGLELLENYYQLEDPRNVVRPNPVQREVWVQARLATNPQHGVTAAGAAAATGSPLPTTTPDSDETETFHVRGIIDRLDLVKVAPGKVVLRLCDYKTGSAPNFKYSPDMNRKIRDEAFFQLLIYALLLRERGSGLPHSMELRFLRLFYLTTPQNRHRATYLECDLGERPEDRDVILQQVHRDLSNVWAEIQRLVQQGDPRAFVGCKRSFCYCHKCRPRFVPGTVWEP